MARHLVAAAMSMFLDARELMLQAHPFWPRRALKHFPALCSRLGWQGLLVGDRRAGLSWQGGPVSGRWVTSIVTVAVAGGR
eukprot:8541687-Pyramimonas_sp.AAC.1